MEAAGGGDSAPTNTGSAGPINGGLTGKMFHSFTDNVGVVDLATGDLTDFTGKTVGTPPRLSFRYDADYIDVSPDGKTLYFIGRQYSDPLISVDIASNTAKNVFQISSQRGFYEIRLSPDGKYFAMVQGDLGDDKGVYIYDTSGKKIVYFEKSSGVDNSVSWTPDNRLLFSDDGIYLTNMGDFENASRVNNTTSSSVSVNPAGDKIAYASKGHIWIMGIDGGNMVQVTTGDNLEFQPRWSPDGKHIVFQSYVKGTNAILGVPGVPGVATVSSLYYLAVIPADGKQYTLSATGPTGSSGGGGQGTVTGIAAGQGVILLQGQNRDFSSRTLSKIAASDMVWR